MHVIIDLRIDHFNTTKGLGLFQGTIFTQIYISFVIYFIIWWYQMLLRVIKLYPLHPTIANYYQLSINHFNASIFWIKQKPSSIERLERHKIV